MGYFSVIVGSSGQANLRCIQGTEWWLHLKSRDGDNSTEDGYAAFARALVGNFVVTLEGRALSQSPCSGLARRHGLVLSIAISNLFAQFD
jgi:hypothetical protein